MLVLFRKVYSPPPPVPPPGPRNLIHLRSIVPSLRMIVWFFSKETEVVVGSSVIYVNGIPIRFGNRRRFERRASSQDEDSHSAHFHYQFQQGQHSNKVCEGWEMDGCRSSSVVSLFSLCSLWSPFWTLISLQKLLIRMEEPFSFYDRLYKTDKYNEQYMSPLKNTFYMPKDQPYKWEV